VTLAVEGGNRIDPTGAVDCPDCRSPMREVSARARSGYLLALDQCAGCGGIWFDRWELFPLHHSEVGRLDPLDAERLYAAVSTAGARDCPRCEVSLREFRDANLPADVRVARCHVCEGMWLQRGQLRAVKRPAPPTPAGAEPNEAAALVALAEAYEGEADWSRVRSLDHATYETEEPPPDLADIGDAVKATLPWIALQILFRLLLRR
jgi:Zn-finger nucleic acid-binding protein